ncbi:MAG: rhomboid family intramembrane serine protease [Candidatus Bathyarchaeota archaeon]
MWILIAVNGLVFWWEFTQGFDDSLFFTYGEIPFFIMRGQQLLTVITSMFIHVDFLHIISNMLYLYIFGDNVEDKFGHVKFFFLYIFFGIVGGLAHSVFTVVFGAEPFIPAVGASGAISGVLGAYLVFFPSARIVSVVPSYFFVRLARIPAFVFIGFWFILQILYSGGSSSVAYLAHIGGFVAGVILALIFKALNIEKMRKH